MKNIDNAYLVLSIAEIRTMLAAAELEQKVRGDFQDRVCIVLQDLTISDLGKKNCEPQICSWSVSAAVAKCIAESTEDLAKAAQKTACMNHSDAAI